MAENFRFSINVKPRYGDEWLESGLVLDLCFHVWARTALFAYMDHIGFKLPNGTTIPLKVGAEHKTPLLMKEEAKVYGRVSRIGRSSTTWEAQINEAVSGRLVANLTLVGIVIDRQTGLSIPNTDEWKQKVMAFEGKENVQISQS